MDRIIPSLAIILHSECYRAKMVYMDTGNGMVHKRTMMTMLVIMIYLMRSLLIVDPELNH